MDPNKTRTAIKGDMLVGISAVVIGLAALAVSLYEARLMRAEQRAAVLPIMELAKSFGPRADAQGEMANRFQFVVQYAGIGPARIRDVHVTIDGEPVKTWVDVIRALGGDDLPEGLRYTQSQITGRTLPPGDPMVVFELGDPMTAARINASIERFDMSLCYCSVFETCWESRYSERDEPTPVPECRAGDDTFAQ
ncbi:MAG: hypothetical protein AAF350_12665 [Pseudomonadota bacterium]